MVHPFPKIEAEIVEPIRVPKVEFLGLDFDLVTQGSALESVSRLARSGHFSYVVTPNVDHMVRLHDEEGERRRALWDAYECATLCLCDSRVLARLAAISGMRLPVVTGSDLTARLLHSGLVPDLRVALIGGHPQQREWLAENHPNTEWIQHLPPMGVRDSAEAQQAIVEFVESTRADLVLFAIGAPQSELLAARLATRGRARGVALCIGSSVAFITGEKRRAPRAVQRMGLEWAFRLVTEPRRLWRRYLVEGPRIFPIWLEWRRQQTRRKPVPINALRPGPHS